MVTNAVMVLQETEEEELDDDRPVEVRNFNAIQIASKNTHPY
jgi:hypothetical protein